MVGTGTLLSRCRCATSWRDPDLTFDLVVTMSFKILSGYFLDSVRCRRLTLGRDIGLGCRCASWCDL